ncbi:MAG: hypothetical protein N4A72_05505 [Bacteroidales bacterium]|jgi:hypothetical protein|nr:hypothetical protein [Bacteroidales bacterium]
MLLQKTDNNNKFATVIKPLKVHLNRLNVYIMKLVASIPLYQIINYEIFLMTIYVAG